MVITLYIRYQFIIVSSNKNLDYFCQKFSCSSEVRQVKSDVFGTYQNFFRLFISIWILQEPANRPIQYLMYQSSLIPLFHIIQIYFLIYLSINWITHANTRCSLLIYWAYSWYSVFYLHKHQILQTIILRKYYRAWT